MVMKSACKLQVGREQFDGKVRMEADHIDFAGQTKFRFRLAEIRSPRLNGDSIQFDFHGNQVSIKLDTQKSADAWIDYILHPQTLADKLGVKQGATVRILNLEDPELMTSLADKGTKVISSSDRCDVVMLAVDRPAELHQIEDLSQNLEPGGAIWVVLPKSVRTITKASVLASAREAGLSQTESIDYSESQAAYKIVPPDGAKKRTRASSGNGNGRAKTRRRKTAVKAD